jgi:hypothetical protein
MTATQQEAVHVSGDELMAERIRQDVRRLSPPDAALLPFGDDEGLQRDLMDLHGLYALVDVSSPPPERRGQGRLRRALAPLLFPDLARQTAHNAAATRLIAYLLEQLSAQAQTIQELEGRHARRGQDWASGERV